MESKKNLTEGEKIKIIVLHLQLKHLEGEIPLINALGNRGFQLEIAFFMFFPKKGINDAD
ncbi:MAG: hypothetical protein JRF35_10485 [Deltaproteobacteria bacterium]|nr:hypothetical protein [Deltaproteobacteria bacterium]MBW2149181.1 hypothetical protein [Deltaproteobacteria bacterium]MBW2311485.1 hypothetical protein [Deltaproteobacteria bacterium]